MINDKYDFYFQYLICSYLLECWKISLTASTRKLSLANPNSLSTWINPLNTLTSPKCQPCPLSRKENYSPKPLNWTTEPNASVSWPRKTSKRGSKTSNPRKECPKTLPWLKINRTINPSGLKSCLKNKKSSNSLIATLRKAKKALAIKRTIPK